MAESERVRFDRGSQHRRMPGRRHSPELSIRRSKTQRLARSRFHLERFLPDEILRADRASQATVRRAILQLIQPSEFWASEHVLAGIPGKLATPTGFGALTYTTSPPTGLLGGGLGGDSTPRMIAFQLRIDF